MKVEEIREIIARRKEIQKQVNDPGIDKVRLRKLILEDTYLQSYLKSRGINAVMKKDDTGA